MIRDKWILLAEDNLNDADLASRALEEEDDMSARVVVAHDGVEVLDCLRRHGEFSGGQSGNPMVVLLDLHMPRINGFDVLEEIKSDPRLKHIPVVIFTSSRDDGDLSRCYQLGANAYVIKPVDFQNFIEALKAVTVFWTMVNQPPPESMGREHVSPLKHQHHWV